MPGDVNCIFTKVLIPFVEKEVGPEGVAAVLRMAGRSREYLSADHNWIPLSLMTDLIQLTMTLMGETDERQWSRRYEEYLMEWRPSRADRSYLGTYGMALAEPRRYFQRVPVIGAGAWRCVRLEPGAVGRGARLDRVGGGGSRAQFRLVRATGVTVPPWICTVMQVQLERAPTVGGLPATRVTERACAPRGADACVFDVRWTNPPLGRSFWTATLAGAPGSVLVAAPLALASAAGGT